MHAPPVNGQASMRQFALSAHGQAAAFMGVIASVLWCPPHATAQPDVPEGPVGHGQWAQPGLLRLSAAQTETPGLSLAVDGSYALTEAQPGAPSADGWHHRIEASGAVGWRILPWLYTSAQFGGRRDRHQQSDRLGQDSSGTLGMRFGAGGAWQSPSGWAIGPEIAHQRPGLGAGLVDVLVNSAWHMNPRLSLIGRAGYRIDRSSTSLDNPTQLRVGDFIALDVSAHNAVLLGTGTSLRWGQWELISELNWQLLVGESAPAARLSPLRLGAGVRIPLTTGLRLTARVEGALQARPDPLLVEPLIPITPRLQTSIGLRYQPRFGRRAGPTDAPPPEPMVDPWAPEEPVPAASAQTEPQQPAAKPTRPARPSRPQPLRFEGEVLDEMYRPISGARVRVAEGERVTDVKTGKDGRFTVEVEQQGNFEVTVQAPGFRPISKKYRGWRPQRDRAGTILPSIELEPVGERGQLRGVVRTLDGERLPATITIDDELTVHADAEGRFEVTLPIGTYRVHIKQEGFRPQHRRIRIENRGVTVLNADMYRK
ncbi:MAG: carboxypeptidase regulatory-like domain-containing protein [Polyangiales bacterium]